MPDLVYLCTLATTNPTDRLTSDPPSSDGTSVLKQYHTHTHTHTRTTHATDYANTSGNIRWHHPSHHDWKTPDETTKNTRTATITTRVLVTIDRSESKPCFIDKNNQHQRKVQPHSSTTAATFDLEPLHWAVRLPIANWRLFRITIMSTVFETSTNTWHCTTCMYTCTCTRTQVQHKINMYIVWL